LILRAATVLLRFRFATNIGHVEEISQQIAPQIHQTTTSAAAGNDPGSAIAPAGRGWNSGLSALVFDHKKAAGGMRPRLAV
jgi:hypothetical protein